MLMFKSAQKNYTEKWEKYFISKRNFQADKESRNQSQNIMNREGKEKHRIFHFSLKKHQCWLLIYILK